MNLARAIFERAPARRRRAYLLLLAVVLMGGVAMTLTLIARHTIVSVRTSIRHRFDIRAAQLVADAQAWIALHSDRVAALEPGEAIELDPADVLPPAMTGSLQIRRTGNAGLLVRAKIQSGEQVALVEVRTPLPPTEAAP
jgi:hypothetical protein